MPTGSVGLSPCRKAQIWSWGLVGLEGVRGAVPTLGTAQGCGLGMASPEHSTSGGGPISVFSSREGDGLGMDGASDWGVF